MGNPFVKFNELHLNPEIVKALGLCGYTEPTPVQARSIPLILAGKDLVASAQTGTGKTAAFVLPILHKLSLQQKARVAAGPQKFGRKKPVCLILTPTRELAGQITTAVSKYGKFLQPGVVSLVGGMPYPLQIKQLRSEKTEIIVATPGRLMDHMASKRIDLSGIDMLVLDEADRMLDMGFIDDVRKIASTMPKERQTLLFSATVDGKLTRIIRELLNTPERIDLSPEKITPTSITQTLYLADNAAHKTRLLLHFLKEEKVFSAIVFCATKRQTDELADLLCNQDIRAAALHGDLRQNVRNRTVEQLRRGKIQILVATDVVARGIDIQNITHVFNFDMPRFAEDYVHRIGRTGRAGRTGIAISFTTPTDIRHVRQIERLMNQQLTRQTITGLEPRKPEGNGFAPRHKAGAGAKRRKPGGGSNNSRPFATKTPGRFKNRGNDKNEATFGEPRTRSEHAKKFGSKKPRGKNPEANRPFRENREKWQKAS